MIDSGRNHRIGSLVQGLIGIGSVPTFLVGLGWLISLALGSPASAGVRVLDAGGLPAEAAGLILTGRDGGTIPVEVIAIPLKNVDRKVRISLWIEALVGDLNLADDSQFVEIYAYAVDSSDAVIGSLLKVVEVSPDDETGTRRSHLRFHGEIDLPSGEAHIRVLVRDHHSGAVGLRTVTTDVSILRRGDPRFLPPFALATQPGWVFADGNAGESSGSLQFGSQLTALPILRSGTARVNWASTGDWTSLVFDLECGDDKYEIEKARFQTLGSTGPWTYGQAELQLPEPTSFNCAATWRDSAGVRPETSAPARLILLGASSPQIGSWAELDALSQSSGASEDRKAGLEGELRDGLALADSEVQVRLRDILSQRADGSSQDWIRQMDLLETEALGGGPAYQDLIKVELGFLKHLTRQNPEALLPIMDLYRLTYRHYQEASKSLLATHTVRMAGALAKTYYESSDAEHKGNQAADLLLLMTTLLSGGSGIFAESLLIQGLEYSPNHLGILRRLAALYSRKGLFERGIPLLLRTVEIVPQELEFRIRLAVALDRTGAREAAQKHLEGMIAIEGSAWPIVAAYQELSRFHLESERWTEAEKVLSSGLERFPQDEKLVLLRANLWDQQRDPAKARNWLQLHIQQDDSEVVTSPRHHLGQSLGRLPDEVAERWKIVAMNSQQHLSKVLEQVAP